MIDAAPRITAGYDADAPREMVFPAAPQRSGDEAGAAADPARLAGELAAALTRVCGVEVSATPMAGPPLAALSAWRSSEDCQCTIGGGTLLAAALLNRECGGAFEAAAVPDGSTHVERRAARLATTLRDRLAGDEGEWTAAPPGGTCAFAVTVGGVADRIDLGLVMPPAEAAVRDLGDWPQRLRSALDGLAVPVRLVIHETRLAVRAVQALRVGDVVPIATAHEVGLRVGTLALARGEVVDSGGGAQQVRIVARARRSTGEQP